MNNSAAAHRNALNHKHKLGATRRVTILFYLLTGYVLLQFAWWAYLLVDLNTELYASQGKDVVNLKIWMVIGEGAVFLVFLLAGIYIMQRTIRKEIALVRQQRNFLLSITHELKTPVAAIKLVLQTLVKRDTLNAEQRAQIQQTAIENTERLHALIDNVLLATRIESGQEPVQLETKNLSELTRQICTGVLVSLLPKNKLTSDIQVDIIAEADPNAYESILINLVENAAKYAENSDIFISLKRGGNRALLTVADGGPGIPDEAKSQIFEKFYRMGNEETRSKKGTGLGLYIVKELCDLHKASISVENNYPSGTIFRISFPVLP
jgi:signal transduction histidine kinase